MPSFVCKDIGMDCKFQTSAPTEAELMKKIAEHAKSVHKIDPVPPDLIAKIKKAIKKITLPFSSLSPTSITCFWHSLSICLLVDGT